MPCSMNAMSLIKSTMRQHSRFQVLLQLLQSIRLLESYVPVAFVTILHYVSFHVLYGQYVDACHEQLLCSCPMAKDEAYNSGNNGGVKGPWVNTDNTAPHEWRCLRAHQIVHEMRRHMDFGL